MKVNGVVAQPSPMISVWVFRRAPAKLRNLFPGSAARDWVVHVPASLAGGDIERIFLVWLSAGAAVVSRTIPDGIVYRAARFARTRAAAAS